MFKEKFENGVVQQNPNDEKKDNIYGIIQGALFCKGYSTGSTDITCNFYSGTGNAIKKLKADAGCSDTSSNVTLNVMKALLSMDQFKLVKGGNSLIQTVQRTINSKYEDYIGLAPCDGLYGRQMNTALIKVLQAIEGQTPEQANGNFGPTTTANLPIIPTDESLSAKTKEEAIFLGKYALVCNGYNISVGTATWENTLVNKIKEFQGDMFLEQTGNLDKNTWMALLLSKGNPDRSYNACDTAYTMSKEGRIEKLKEMGINIIGRYIVGDSKILQKVSDGYDIEEVEKIVKVNGFKFFPIYQVDGTPGTHHFTQQAAYTAARLARIRAKSFKIPENSIIYFAVDFDAVDTEILNIIIPYFKIIKENIGCYKVGVYGTRNVCTQVMNSKYAESCFVSDMSTGYSGNMGYKMPKDWNLDQFAEIGGIPAAGGNFAIDKVNYSGKQGLVTGLMSDKCIRGFIDDITISSSYIMGTEREYSGNRLKLYVSATKANGDIPDGTRVVVSIKAGPNVTNPLDAVLHTVTVNPNGELKSFDDEEIYGEMCSIDYARIENGGAYYLTYEILTPDHKPLKNGEINVHIEIETEYR